MNRTSRWTSGGAIVALLSAALLVAAQDKPDKGGKVGQDKKAMEPQKPGPEHAALKAFEGTWDCVVTHCADHGDGKTVKGTETNKIVCDGFWLATEHKSEMAGKPFEGRGYMGYDPLAKEYELAWIGNMSGCLSLFKGSYDNETRTYLLKTDMKMPDGKTCTLKIVHSIQDPDHSTFNLIGVGAKPDGKDCNCVTINYTRHK